MDVAQPTGRPAAHSILFLRPEDGCAGEAGDAPDCFVDLNLDQVVASIVRGRDEYDLVGYFGRPLTNADTVAFRQDVFRDIESKEMRLSIDHFAAGMRWVRGLLRQHLRYRYQRATWFFEAAEIYGRAVEDLAQSMSELAPASFGMRRFEDHLSAYTGSVGFRTFRDEAAGIRVGLASVRYNLRIGSGRVTVSSVDTGPDYSAQIEATFERFRRGEVRDYLATFNVEPDLNHVGILDQIALIYPDTFGALDEFVARHQDFMDPTIAAFDREVQFYLAYLEFIDRLRSAGLRFCYPRVSAGSKGLRARQTFDVALAAKLVAQDAQVVTNDVCLRDLERVIVVTGPNQGGKTTFARAFGQLLHLASLGCPVAGSEAAVPLCDQVLTHFGREENLFDLRSRLEDELLRMQAGLQASTARSALVLNEVFTSTTLADAIFLGREILARIEERDLVCVWVTFIDELASASKRTVSMVSNVLPDDPTVRTFKITRRPADGHAYAEAIAAKYGVDYPHLRVRLPE